MMTKTYTLTTIEHAVEIATTLSGSWFRGHARIYGELTPKVFRQQEVWEVIRDWRPDIEFSLIEAFKRGAPVLAANTPNYNDHIAWLFLMQHHGTPTRLLDWTESALVALYFAVSKHPSDDGELWAMYPNALNKHSEICGLPTSNNPILHYLVAEPLHSKPKRLAEDLGLGKIPEYPLAVQPPMHFPRMVAQLSTFTIHPHPKPGSTIPELLTDEEYLVRYIVPKSSKRKLLNKLAALGITARTLFPDLDHLSETIVLDHHEVAYSPPAPPQCAGEWRSEEKKE